MSRGRGERVDVVRRRELLFGASGLVAASGVVADRAQPGDLGESGVLLSGRIERVESAQTALLRTPGRSRPIAVDLGPGTQPRSEGPVELTAFEAGQEVIVQGSWRGERFSAAQFEAIFHLVDGTVTERDGDRLDTTGGTMRLTPSTRPRGGHTLGYHVEARPLAELAPGHHIVALGRIDPGANEVRAMLVGAVMR
jgi:hypothetical protein